MRRGFRMEKMIFVIGAGSGLGNGVAEKFARQGFKLVLMARNEERLAGYAAYFADKGYDAETKMVDVTDFSAFAQTFQTAVQEYGTPNVVFYNVGITAPDDKSKLDAQTLVDHYIADVAGAYNVIKLAVTEDFAAKKGAILVTGGGRPSAIYRLSSPFHGQSGSPRHGTGSCPLAERTGHLHRYGAGNGTHRLQRTLLTQNHSRKILGTL